MKADTIFISGIDTDAGKSYATGWLAARLADKGLKVRTQKFIQTGNEGRSEDIELHRKITGEGLADEPWELTAPEIYTYPASPHLSAEIDGRPVSLAKIDAARERLEATCDVLLVEGAGGLMVPVDRDTLTIDYISSRGLDVALVTNGKLGSISHTLLALEAIRTRGLRLRWLLYNSHFDTDRIIAEDAREFIRSWASLKFPETEFLIVPSIELGVS
ncbi:MAG: dethiobiotin synthase [Muribaculaceae bacterium]|nr:dethiobiotin synthase [Muribaculaceae bacterium]